jgi:glucokinase
MTDAREVVAAIDIGGTLIKSALVSREYEALVELTVPTPKNVGGSIGDVVAMIIGELGKRAGGLGIPAEIVGCGVVVPGIVDDAAQVARFAVNLGWRDLRIADAVREATGLGTALGHDVRAALIAETRAGAARGVGNMLFVALGTGIAAATMVDGRVLVADGWAGEFGHMVVDPQGPSCACGGIGCLEAISSASAVAREYASRTGARLDARAVARLVDSGDVVATEVWTTAVQALARGLVSAVAMTGVELILVGGGLAQSGETLFRPLRAAVAEQLTFHRPPRLERAMLGDRAGCLGAAHLAWGQGR